MRSAISCFGFVLAFLAVPAALAQSFGQNKVRWDEFEWRVYETPHFKISYYDRSEPQLEKVASYAESSYNELSRKLNTQITEPINLLAYATHAEFEQTNVLLNFIPEGVGAFAIPSRNRMVLPIDLPDRELQNLIQHELTHIFQFEIFFSNKLSSLITQRLPQWFMEGMASYLGNDEDARDQMIMRDASLSDDVPSLLSQIGGYPAYRFGNKVFTFIEDEWGEEGVRDFVFGFRNSFGGGLQRTMDRTFDMSVEEFDAKFRRWLRKRYAENIDRGHPDEFGRRFRISRFPQGSVEVSPVASPSGDLVAAFATYKNDVDVVIFGVPDRRLYKNLTKGYTTHYEYLIAQGFTVGPESGRDLAFSPDGNQVAVFARKGRGRSLMLLDAHGGGIDESYPISLPIDQATQPAWSPNGRTVAFSAVANGTIDLFTIDLDTSEITRLTSDEPADLSPTFTPDGDSIVYSRQVGEQAKLAKIDLRSRVIEQMTFGPGNDEGPAFSLDGSHLYFASDRDDAIFDIYDLDIERGELFRLTEVIGGALNPAPITTQDGERVIYQAYSRGQWHLYVTEPGSGDVVDVLPAASDEDLSAEPYLPAVSLPVDLEKSHKVKGFKLFVEDARGSVGISNDQTVLSQAQIILGDTYGDRRFIVQLSAVDDFSNFRLSYLNLRNRLQWGVTLFDDRTFYYTGFDTVRGEPDDRRQFYRVTGALLTGQYPINGYFRTEGAVGYIDRKVDYPVGIDAEGNVQTFAFDDQVPIATIGLVGDTTLWRSWGPHAGHRFSIETSYLHDLDNSGSLSTDLEIDYRKYLPLSKRNELAMRLYGVAADGNRPNIYSIGGLDTIRGLDYRSFSGNRAFHANLEWRFPIIDRLDMPFLQLREIRGRAFFDVGAAWADIDGFDNDFTFIDDGRLVDGIASYGFGFSLRLFGLPMHWDFSRLHDGKTTLTGVRTDFWIGLAF